MQTDVKGRALPWAEPDEDDPNRPDRISIMPADVLGFEWLDRHGDLSTLMLQEIQKPLRSTPDYVVKRLHALHIGSKEQGHILTSPGEQFQQRFAHSRHKVYRITPYARSLITPCKIRPTHSNWFVHDLGQSTAAASFELTAPLHGLRYVPRSEVLLHELSGTARTSETPMIIPYGKGVRPDDVFALENENGKRSFIMEFDRGNERMTHRDKPKEGATYFARKLEAYDDLMEYGGLKKWFGFATARLLIITVSPTRARQIHADVSKLKNAGRFFITVVPEFGQEWRVPDRVLTELLGSPWLTVDGPRKITD